VTQKRERLQSLVAERAAWSERLRQIKRLHGWLLEVEQILDGSWVQPEERVSNTAVGQRLDTWRSQHATLLVEGEFSELEQTCLREFLQTLSNLRSYLVHCYDSEDFPRTNNDLERCIRGLKTQYRRVSGRKNWNAYLLRYGRCVAYAAWWEQDAAHQEQFEQRVGHLDRNRWRELRHETTTARGEQLTRFRFRHHREAFLNALEERWAAAPSRSLP
jgi:hypothetical protein